MSNRIQITISPLTERMLMVLAKEEYDSKSGIVSKAVAEYFSNHAVMSEIELKEKMKGEHINED